MKEQVHNTGTGIGEGQAVAKNRKNRLLLLYTAVVMLLCSLSGCWQPATRRELIDWFQKNYTDAPLTVSRGSEDDGITRLPAGPGL